jgi:RHS repeat-associated protein
LSVLLVFLQGTATLPGGAEAAPVTAAAADATSEEAAAVALVPPEQVPVVPVPPTLPLEIPAQPTDQQLFQARLFDEPLVPVGGVTSAPENAALAGALIAYTAAGSGDAVTPLRQFLTSHPSSPWRASLLVNLSAVMRRTGHYSRALEDAQGAWALAREASDERPAAVGDRALGEIVELLSRLGRYEELETLLAEVSGREILGSATEKVSQAKQALWIMQNRPDVAFRCGPFAMERVFVALNPGVAVPAAIAATPSTSQGTSLAQMHQLSQQIGTNMQMAFRQAGSSIVTPALVHWRSGHFAAIVREEGGRFLVQDPTFGEETWITSAAIDDEASGYFIIPSASLGAGWRSVASAEAAGVWGKGVPNGQNPQGQGCNGGPGSGGNGGSCGPGGCAMATYTLQTMLVNLHIVDTPVRYSPAVGPSVSFRISYNQRDAFQPQTFTYGNTGPKWTHDWLSYVTDAPNVVGGTVTVYLRGGGEETYTGYNPGNQEYGAHFMRRAVLKRVAGPPVRYERLLPDGSKEVFAQADGATAPRRLFLTQVIDAQGQGITFQYDGNLRLASVTDATGLATTLSYEDTDPLRITKVTDPYGRLATFTYGTQRGRPLASITDPIGIVSQFVYGSGHFIRELTTPYGTTKFAMGESGLERWLEATDPLGGTERLVYQNQHSASVPQTDPPATIPTGFSNQTLGSGLSFFWNKRAMALAAGDVTKAEMSHWLWMPGPNSTVPVLRTFKKPLENRVWYAYPGQPDISHAGTHSTPSEIARVLDDGTTQSYKFAYNAAGRIIKQIDPVGRETVYVYGTGSTADADPTTGIGRDLLQIRQKNTSSPSGYDVVQSLTYNTKHQPETTIDSAGQTTTRTFLPDGRIATVVTPQRNGPTGVPLTPAERTTTYTYYADNDVAARRKRIQTITGPSTTQGAPFMTYTYDAYGRVMTTTDQEGYVILSEYDALDRKTRTTFPDGTAEEIGYSRLDAERRRDRLGRWSHRFHDALQRVTSTRDPEGRSLTYQWCSCGSLDRMLDANGNVTSLERDLQGRVTREVRADNSAWEYLYESTTSRLHQRKDPQNQVITYSFLRDDTLGGIAYTNEVKETANVSFGYDPSYRRVATMADGTGPTAYAYHAITASPGLGAGQLASVDGPLANDTMTYAYDAMGRRTTRQINGGANQEVLAYDALARVASLSTALGSFTFGYEGATKRLANVGYPNGQTSTYSYLANPGDHRVQDIHHRGPGGGTLARQTYSTSPVGQIASWTQQIDAASPVVYEYTYDRADQLTSAVLKTTGVGGPVVAKTNSYAYDLAGNRTTESADSTVVKATYDNRNRLLQTQVGGSLRFAGTLNEAATVTVAGQAATVAGDQTFSGAALVTGGSQTVPIVATDPAGNVRNQSFQLNVTGTGGAIAHDANGNVTSDGVRTFEWDAEDRLVRVLVSGIEVVRFAYDGNGRRRQRVAGGVTSDYLVGDSHVAEERLSGGLSGTIRYFHGPQTDHWLARQESNGAATYFVADHLGSVVRYTDGSGLPTLTRSYDAWGRLDSTSTAVGGPAFTGREWDPEAALYYYRARYYSPTLARFLSEDPVAGSGSNRYAYVGNRPIAFVDPFGLMSLLPPPLGPFCKGETDDWFVPPPGPPPSPCPISYDNFCDKGNCLCGECENYPTNNPECPESSCKTFQWPGCVPGLGGPPYFPGDPEPDEPSEGDCEGDACVRKYDEPEAPTPPPL